MVDTVCLILCVCQPIITPGKKGLHQDAAYIVQTAVAGDKQRLQSLRQRRLGIVRGFQKQRVLGAGLYYAARL